VRRSQPRRMRRPSLPRVLRERSGASACVAVRAGGRPDGAGRVQRAVGAAGRVRVDDGQGARLRHGRAPVCIPPASFGSRPPRRRACLRPHTHARAHTHSHSHSHKHTDTLTHTHTHTHSHPLTHTHTLTLTPTHTHTHTCTHTLTRTHARIQTRTHARTHAHSRSLTHTHTHTHACGRFGRHRPVAKPTLFGGKVPLAPAGTERAKPLLQVSRPLIA
jgi:hypothetical protein